MKAQFLKIAGVKSEAAFYKKFPSEEAFFNTHPEARIMKFGGAPTADQFFDYGMQAKGPLLAPETSYKTGGSNGVQGGNINAVGGSIKSDFESYIRSNVANNMMNEPLDQQSPEQEEMAYGGQRRLRRAQEGMAMQEQASMQEQAPQQSGDPMAQIAEQVGQALQQGAKPEEVVVQLLQSQMPPEAVAQIFVQLGMPQEQVQQLITTVIEQVQGAEQGAPQEQMMPPQDQMMAEEQMDPNQVEQMPMAQYGMELPQRRGNSFTDMYQKQLDSNAQGSKDAFGNLVGVFQKDVDSRVQKGAADLKAKDQAAFWDQFKKKSENWQTVQPVVDNSITSDVDMGQGQSIDLAPQNPNPWQMKQGGALKKFLPKHQTDGIVQPYVSPVIVNTKRDITKIKEENRLKNKTIKQKELDDKEIAIITRMEKELDLSIEAYNKNPGGIPYPKNNTPLGIKRPYNNPEFYENLIKAKQDELDKTIKNYNKSRGLKTEEELKYDAAIKASAAANIAKLQRSDSDATIKQTEKETPKTTTKTKVATTTVPKTKTTAVPVTTTTPAKTATPGKTLIIPKSVSKPKSDTIYTDDVFKQGGSLTKYQTGTVVKTEVSNSTKNSKTTYSDGTIVIKDPQGNIISTTPGTSNTTTNPPSTTTTTTAQTDIEKAVRLLAESKGLDPDTTWKNYQAGPTNTNTNRGYSGYPVKIKGKTWDPATGNRTGKIKINPTYGGYNMYNGADGNNSNSSGFMPNAAEIQAMQNQAFAKGYNITPTYGKTLFGRKKLTIEMRTNPVTGEKTPVITNNDNSKKYFYPETFVGAEDTRQFNHPNTYVGSEINPINNSVVPASAVNPNVPLTQTDFEKPYVDLINQNRNTVTPIVEDVTQTRSNIAENQYEFDKKYNQGGALNRFLPQHRFTGSTDSEKGDLIGKFTYKEKKPMNVNPFAADYMMAGMGVAESALNRINDPRLRDQLAYSQEAGQQYDSVGKDMGDYVPDGQQYGAFRPNEMIPTFDTGYEPGNAAGDYGNYSKQGGPISPYPYPSQIPFMQGNGNSKNMSMYSGWSQRPVMQYGGGYQQNMDDAMYLDEDEINQIIAMGGQIEYLD